MDAYIKTIYKKVFHHYILREHIYYILVYTYTCIDVYILSKNL